MRNEKILQQSKNLLWYIFEKRNIFSGDSRSFHILLYHTIRPNIQHQSNKTLTQLKLLKHIYIFFSSYILSLTKPHESKYVWFFLLYWRIRSRCFYFLGATHDSFNPFMRKVKSYFLSTSCVWVFLYIRSYKA